MKLSNTRLFLQLQATSTPQRPGASSGRATLGPKLNVEYPDAKVMHTMRLRSTAAEIVTIDLATLALTGGPYDVVATKADGKDYEGLDFGGDLTFLNAVVLDRATYDPADEDIDGTDILVTIGSSPSVYEGRPFFNDASHIGFGNSGVSVIVADIMTVTFYQPDQLVEITFVGKQA